MLSRSRLRSRTISDWTFPDAIYRAASAALKAGGSYVFACHGAPEVVSDDQDGLEHANMTVRMRRSVRLAT